MKVPLISKTIIGRDNQQYIEIWRNSRKEIVPSPIKPYFYSSYPMKFPFEVQHDIQDKTLLSTLKPSKVHRYSFKNTKYVSQYREDDSFEANIVFTDRILIDEPNYFDAFPNTDNLKVLHFDCEMDTTGMFPTPDRNAITGIGAICGNRKVLYMSKTYDDDKEIILKFFDFIRQTDPDIISHYNGNNFDIPYLIKRMEINHIPIDLWSRHNKKPYDFKGTWNFNGRLSFDIYNQVTRDQTLFGIKNHKMKTVAKWFKFPDVVEIPMDNMRSIVNTKELRDYLKSDVNITEFLFKIYFANVLTLSEMNKIPLNLLVRATPSFLPRIIHGRAFQNLNIISDKNNMERHPTYIHNKRGAIVDTYLPGLYLDPVYKIDFSSQYPNAVRTFNISPETTRIIRYEDYTGEYKFDMSNQDKYVYTIPDSIANKNIIIEVDMSKRGFLPKFMDAVLSERFKIKAEMKTLDKDSSKYEYLYSRQNALKVIANVQTGYEGQLHARFGSLACYNMITGMCRYYIQEVIDKVNE